MIDMRRVLKLMVMLALLGATLMAGEGTWIPLAPMSDPRQEVGAAELNGKIYVIGGLPRTDRVQEYDPANNSWRFVASLPIAVDHTAAVSVGGKLYVMGGDTNSGSTAAVFEYDPGTNQWTQKAPMPTARNALAAAVIAGKIYAVGGTGGNSTGRELEVYDPATNSWTSLPQMPTGRNHIGVGAVQNKLYVAGGRPGNLRVLEVFDPATSVWSTKAPMPTGRSGHAAAVVRDRLYTSGGEGNSNSLVGIFQETEVYDPATDTWKSLDPMPTPRHGIGAAVVGNRIYVPGGATQQGGGSQTGAHDAFVIQPEKLFFGHFASGQGITTETVTGNLSEGQSSLVTVELFDQDGNPLTADLGGSMRSKITATLAPLGSVTMRSADPGTTLRVGWVLVSAELPVTGTILFASVLPGFRGIAGVGAGTPLTRFFVPVQRDPFTQVDSGIAIANISDSTITINLVLRNESGAVLGTRVLALPPRAQTARFLTQLFPTADIVTFTFRGAVTATSTGPLAALALLFTGNEFATLPVTTF